MFADATAQPDTFADPALDRPGSCAADTPSNSLLGLVRRLVAHGKTLVARLRAQPDPVPPEVVAIQFGTRNLMLIIARIMRGVMLAVALERRVARAAGRVDDPPSPPTRGAERADEPRRKSASPRRDFRRDPIDESLLQSLPTAQAIAERVRGRRIGDVLVDICHDLGITAGHPLWRDLQRARLVHGGAPGALQRNLIARTLHTTLRRLGVDIVPVPERKRRRSQRRARATGPP